MDWCEIAEVLDAAGLQPPEPDWIQRAHCRNLTPAESDAIFYPDTKPPARKWTAADDYCCFCPVFDSCISAEFIEALRQPTRYYSDQIHGIRASMRQVERRKMLNRALRKVEARNGQKVSA